jgi:hypothetical protein
LAPSSPNCLEERLSVPADAGEGIDMHRFPARARWLQPRPEGEIIEGFSSSSAGDVPKV